MAELFVFAFEKFVAAKHVAGAMLCSGHEPGAGIIGDAGLGLLLKSGDESVLREFFGYAHVPHDSSEPRDHASRLDSPDRFDRPVCLGSRHSYRSDHVRSGSGNLDAILGGRDLMKLPQLALAVSRM